MTTPTLTQYARRMKYYTRSDIARELGISQQGASELRLPAPDARIGDTRVWERSTVNLIVAARNRGERIPRGTFHTPAQYFTTRDIAEMLDVARSTIHRAKDLPEPDATAGPLRGWLPETIETWADNRPSK